MKILIVDDDPRVRRSLERILKEEYVVDCASNAEGAEELAYNNYYDVVLLDLMLPDMDGEDLASVMKVRLPNLPIIAISGKTAIEDKDYALRKGCDDYIIKPISTRELKARIHAVIRRYDEKKILETEIMCVRDLIFDKKRRAVTYKDEKIELRKKEIQVLEFMMLNRQKLITRSDILENVWEADANHFSNTVDVHIKHLRNKIENPYNEKFIHTRHGMGFVFE